MTFGRNSSLKFTRFCADVHHTVAAPFHHWEDHSVPVFSDIGLIFYPLFLLCLFLLQDQVTVFLQSDGLIGWQLAENICRVDARRLVEMAPGLFFG